jgi:hypothetical protein
MKITNCHLLLLFFISGHLSASSLNLALGVQWSNFDKRGQSGNYLTKEFLEIVIKPLINRISTEIIRQDEVDDLQNYTLVGLVIICGGGILFTLAYVYLKKKMTNKLNQRAGNANQNRNLEVRNANQNRNLEADV